MNEELKPCPFCGGEARVMYAMAEDGTRTISVICQSCRTGIFRARSIPDEWNAYKTADEAIEAWNRRVFTPLVNISEEVRNRMAER